MKSAFVAKGAGRPHLDILQLDLEVPLVMRMLLGQIDGMGVTACLAQNLDGCLHIKVDLALAGLRGRERAEVV